MMRNNASSTIIRGVNVLMILIISIIWNLGFLFIKLSSEESNTMNFLASENSFDMIVLEEEAAINHHQQRNQISISNSLQQQQQQENHHIIELPLVENEDDVVDEWIFDDIDTNRRRVLCDMYKCGFKSKQWKGQGYYVVQNTNIKNDNDFVHHRHHHPSQQQQQQHQDLFSKMKQEWMISKELESQFQINHLLLDPPTAYTINEDLAMRLNNNIRPNEVEYESTSIRQHKVIIQKVQFMSSKSSIPYICSDDDDDYYYYNHDDKESFRRKLQSMTTDNVSSTQNDNDDDRNYYDYYYNNYTYYFRKQFIQDMTSTIDMLISPTPHNNNNIDNNTSCMIKDIRIIFDIQYGRIYHLDLNRCSHVNSKYNNDNSTKEMKQQQEQLPATNTNNSSLSNNDYYYNRCMYYLQKRYEYILKWKVKQVRKQQQQQQIDNNSDDKHNEGGFTSLLYGDEAQEYIKLHDNNNNNNESSWWWVNDLDPYHKQCGDLKCAFRSNTIEGEGYLVSLIKLDKQYELAQNLNLFQDGWTLAKELESKFNVPHLFLEEPKLIHISQDNAIKLNLIDMNITTTNFNKKTTTTMNLKKRNSQGQIMKKIVMQPIQYLSSNRTILYKYDDDDAIERFQDNLMQFDHHVRISGSSPPDDYDDGIPLSKINYDEYKKQLREDLDATINMMEQSERDHSCIFWDFQVLFDVWRGRIYQLDLDRCAQRENRSPEGDDYLIERIIPKLQICYRLLLQWKKKQQQE